MGVTEELARFAVETPRSSVPRATIESARLRFLDTFAVMIAGSRHPSTLVSLEVVRQMGGNPTASIIGHADRTSAPLAGYLNAVAGHAHEYDDYTKGVSHVSVCMAPGCLALAEQLDLSGADLIDAFIMGFEIESRIGKGMQPWLLDLGWHPNGILGAMGLAAAGARLMGFDAMRTRMAFGLAASEGSGVRKNVGSMGKAFHVGHGVQCGLFAVLLAAAGFKVDADIIEGRDDVGGGHDRWGLVDTFNGIGNYNLAKMTEHLGREWELAQNTTIARLHPGSTAPGSSIDGMIDLAIEHDLKPGDVDAIELECTQHCHTIACYPTANDMHRARFCLPYIMASALIDRRAGLYEYSDERVNQPDVQTLMKRVRVSVPEDLKRHHGKWGENGVNWGEMRLSVRMKDGRVFNTQRSHARGWSEEPATWNDLKQKYMECAENILSVSQIDESLAMIEKIDQLPSVRELMQVFRAV